MQSSSLRTLGIVLLAIGVALLVVGIVYWTVSLENLPSFMGHVAGSTKHHTKRALAATVLAVIVLIGGWLALARGRRAQAQPR